MDGWMDGWMHGGMDGAGEHYTFTTISTLGAVAVEVLPNPIAKK